MLQQYLAGGLMALCMLIGALLRGAVFKDVLTYRQSITAIAVHGVLALAAAVVLAWTADVHDMAQLLQTVWLGETVFALMSAAAMALIMRKWIRELIFVLGISLSYSGICLSAPVLLSVGGVLQRGSTEWVFLLAVYLAVLALTCIPVGRMLRHAITPFLQVNTGDYWNAICVLPLIFCGTRFGNVIYQESMEYLLLIMVGNLLSFFLLILTCRSIGSTQKQLQERSVLDRQLEEQRVYYAQLQTRVEEARRTRHDFKTPCGGPAILYHH